MININVDFFFTPFIYFIFNCNLVGTRKLLDVHSTLDSME